jgi:hypothetical protein
MLNLQHIAEEIAENRAKTIDDFCKTYIAARADWFKEKPDRLRKIKLIEQRSNDGLKFTYSIELMSGPPRVLKTR